VHDGGNPLKAIHPSDTRNLPGIHHDLREEEGSVWLEVARLNRKEPPPPPAEIVDWIILSADPTRLPETRSQRIITVNAVERDAALANKTVRPEDVMEAPRKRDGPPDAPPRYDLTLRLLDRPQVSAAIAAWIAGPWTGWAAEEAPRRRTISLYQQLYKLFQLVEIGGNDSPVEVIWGIGVVHWQKEGRIIDRPLLEVRVELELDDIRGGLFRVRPTTTEPAFDLKPYEELGCSGLPQLSDLIRREVHRVGDGEGLSPFIRECFEPILSPAASRLDSEGVYAPQLTDAQPEAPPPRLTVTDQWVLFARPRSQHVLLQDIDRLRKAAADPDKSIGVVAERLITEPSRVAPTGNWTPLDGRIGASGADIASEEFHDTSFDVFFPKPFNAVRIRSRVW
jgi:hypothetical protein